MPALVLLLAGLVLLLAGGSWFAGATTVGIICLVGAAVLILMADGFDRPSRRRL